MKVRQQRHHRFAIRGIQIAGWFVREQDGRVSGQCASHCNTLLLAARKLRRIMANAMQHADFFERLMHHLLAFGRGHGAVGQRQLYVLIYVEIADQVERLEDEADFAIADACALAHLHAIHTSAIQRIGAMRRRIEQAQNRQQGGLTAARWTGDGDILAALNIEVNSGECVSLHLVRAEDLGDAFEADQGIPVAIAGHVCSFPSTGITRHPRKGYVLKWHYGRAGRRVPEN